MEKLVENDTQTLLRAVIATAEPNWIGDVPYTVAHENFSVVSLENMLPKPTRARGKVQVTDAASFISYLGKHADPAYTAIYVDTSTDTGRCVFTAVLNEHTLLTPGWRDYACMFAPTPSVEWKRWTGKNLEKMPQGMFAAWLEDNLPDIVGGDGLPSGSEVLQMATGFERTCEKRLKSRIHLPSGGTRFEYVDDDDRDTRTSMQVFERFGLGIPVFEGATEAYAMQTRLRYREKDAAVAFWYELIRPDRVFRQAVEDMVAHIKEASGLLMLSGSPGL